MYSRCRALAPLVLVLSACDTFHRDVYPLDSGSQLGADERVSDATNPVATDRDASDDRVFGGAHDSDVPDRSVATDAAQEGVEPLSQSLGGESTDACAAVADTGAAVADLDAALEANEPVPASDRDGSAGDLPDVLTNVLAAFDGATEANVLVDTHQPDAAGGDVRDEGRFLVNLSLAGDGSAAPGRCLDVIGVPGTENGAGIQLLDCDRQTFSYNYRNTDQLWELTPEGFLLNTGANKCLDVDGFPGQIGAIVDLWDCEWSGVDRSGKPTDQIWRYEDGQLRNVAGGGCLDIDGQPGTANGAYAHLWYCEEPQNLYSDQRWRFTPRLRATSIAVAAGASRIDFEGWGFSAGWLNVAILGGGAATATIAVVNVGNDGHFSGSTRFAHSSITPEQTCAHLDSQLPNSWVGVLEVRSQTDPLEWAVTRYGADLETPHCNRL